MLASLANDPPVLLQHRGCHRVGVASPICRVNFGNLSIQLSHVEITILAVRETPKSD